MKEMTHSTERGTRWLLVTSLATAMALMLAGCATGKIDTEKDISDSMAEDAKSKPPPELAAAMMPQGSQGNRYTPTDNEPRFDVNANSVDARSFFMGLVQGTEYNMALHPDLTGKVTLSLKNVTVPEVMETVRDLFGYDFRETRSGYIVLPATLQSRVYQVNYLNLKRSGRSDTRVSSGQLSGGSDEDDSQGGSGRSGAGNNNTSNVQVRPSTRIETEGGSDFWPELASTLETVVGNGDGRRVVINAQTGVILVRAMPEEHRQVAEYLATIQDSAQRQVVLEAKIIEVELKEGFQTGINWAALSESGSTTTTGGMVGGSQLFENGVSDLADTPLTLDPGTAALSGFPSSAFGGVFALAVTGSDFTAFLELLDTQGDAKVLSSPRVSTVNNQKAVIKVGSDEFFVTGITSNTTTGTATNTNNSVQLTPFFSGIALDVTPQISQDGDVILHIHPSVSEVSDQRKSISVGDEESQLPLAFSTVRESDSVIRARSGQIVVIGGLMKSSTTRQESGVPLLGDIPLLGHLFRHTSEREVKSELIILLKPIVIGGDDDWDNMTQEYRDRFSN